MLQIIPINKRTEKHVDTATIKYIENIDNADSMTKKYNRAIENFVLNSNEDIICFRHDDTELRTPIDVCDYKVRKLTENHKIAVLGVIGTIALEPSCAWWTGVSNAGGRNAYGAGYIIQGGFRQKVIDNHPLVDKNNKPIMEHYEYPMADCPGIHPYMATVDGCCMFFPKWFFQEGFRFDNNLHDYHFYDADICLQALAAGYKVSTVDIIVKHESEGKPPPIWEALKLNFFNKWNSAVNGRWPISRLTKFNMNNIKVKQKTNIKDIIDGCKTKESKPTV